MTKLTFFPLGSADSILLQSQNDRMILFDYAAMRNSDDVNDNRADLPTLLRERLIHAGKDGFDVVAFTHLDDDHIKGSSEFFYFNHAKKYQDDTRKKIETLWVPATAILEPALEGEKGIIRAEAKHRLKEGKGIKVFSRPDALSDWLEEHGLSIKDRLNCIVDAGTVVEGFDLDADGIEFFAHAPYAKREEDGDLIDRNRDSIVVQATFDSDGTYTRLFLAADIDYEKLEEIVNITEYHDNNERLMWDIYKLPHHCSYKALGPEKGDKKTEPTETVRRFVEEYASKGGIIVSTSNPIPNTCEDGENPPHMPAANYYKEAVDGFDGQFIVTMEYPSETKPKPLEMLISNMGVTILKSVNPVSSLISKPAARAGSN